MTHVLPPGCRIALVLAGGNALGAYQAGVYQALHQGGLMPDWVVGTSIGAINGAIIAGNREEDRIDRLAELWHPAPDTGGWPMWWDAVPDSWRRTGETLATMFAGRAGLFGPLGTGLTYRADRRSLYDTSPADAALSALVDANRLNAGPVRFTAVAVDLDTADDVAFDTAAVTVTPDHVRASAAMPPLYPPVEIDGRHYVDGGLAANLPIDPPLSQPGATPLLCIAVDLLPATAHQPRTLGEMAGRAQDLLFACQTRRSIERWQAAYAGGSPNGRSVTLVRLTYADQEREVAGKAMDFSPASARVRWDAGLRDGLALVERLASGDIGIGNPGLTIVDPDRDTRPRPPHAFNEVSPSAP